MKKLITLAGILAGNFILAFAVSTFILPHDLIANGTAGFSLAMEHYFGLPFTPTLAAINILMLAIGFMFLGKQIFFAAVVSTFVYPIFMELLERAALFPDITENLLLATVFAGALSGVGVGLVLKVGASTGGFDIPPLILNKKFNIPVGATLYVIDTIIILSQMLFSDAEHILYGILLVFLCSSTINKVLLMGNNKAQLIIISDEFDKIKEALLKEMDSGATLLNVETAYDKENMKAILSVTTNRKINPVKERIQEIDPDAFIIVSAVTEVRGRGFTLER